MTTIHCDRCRAEIDVTAIETALSESQAEADKQRHIAANAENMAAMHKAERDEARAECEAIRELMNAYNLGGWTDAIEPMKRALSAEAECERLRDDACHKIMAMSDAQINALNRLEGHDPEDVAKLSKQALEITRLRLSLSAAETREREAYERAAKCVRNKMTFRTVKNSDGEVIDIPHESNKLLAECERLILALAGERREG